MSTKERRIRALKEMARTLRVGGRVMIYVWAMEQKRRRFEKQDVFVPWNPNPPSSAGRSRPCGIGSRSVSDAPESSDQRRNTKSTSSVVDEPDLVRPGQQMKQKRWFFSRSLDSVLDLSSLTVSCSSSGALCSPADETEVRNPALSTRGRGLIRQVSSFFSLSSRTSLDEDVFVPDLHQHKSGHSSRAGETVSVSLVQECSSVALPDLLSCQGQVSEDGPVGDEVPRGESDQQDECSEEKMNEACLRYYHVFREGELTRLIKEHVEELHVLHTCLDHSNWCVVAEKVHVWKV